MHKAYHFDFSSYESEGSYYILDIDRNVRSYEFEISENVYQDVLKAAVKTFYYQRSSFEKETQYAGDWSDAASHVGPLQDKNCRKFNSENDVSTEMDLHGGWFDAGDYNKYTSWTANYVVDFIKAYEQAPDVWGDDYNIPESGNGIPDILDEMAWGLEHLQRLQLDDGSVISVVSSDHASPPSAATGQSLYGDVNTSSTLAAGGAYAQAAILYQNLGQMSKVETLKLQAISAWNWAEANPNVLWYNNDAAYNSVGIGSGQQETDDYGRRKYKIRLAEALFELTRESKYNEYIVAKYQQFPMFEWNNFVFSFKPIEQDVLIHYLSLTNGDQSVKDNIANSYLTSLKTTNINMPAHQNLDDPYLANVQVYTWGSNGNKCRKAISFLNAITYDLDETINSDILKYSERYVHSMHGVNPLSKNYLSNMNSYGSENSVNEFYHTWFYKGTDFDNVQTSEYGPAPGFLVGGPNPQYTLDGCCPSGCGSPENNAKCNEVDMSDVLNQPDQKSYKDVNNNWPINSWSLTENSCSYQMAYIRLLSHFVPGNYDCTGTLNGTQTDCSDVNTNIGYLGGLGALEVYPNPTLDVLNISGYSNSWEILTLDGNVIASGKAEQFDVSSLSPGTYFIHSVDQVVKFTVQ